MAGQVINIIPPRLFSFDTLGSGNSQDIVLHKAVDVSQWPDATLMMRVSDLSLGGGYMYIQAYYVAPTDDDPGQEFVSTQYTSTFLEVYDGMTFPLFQTSPISGPLGAAIKIVLTAYRFGAGDLSAVFSLDMKVTNYFST